MVLLLNNINKNLTNINIQITVNVFNEIDFKNFYNCIEQNISLKIISFPTINTCITDILYINIIDVIFETLFKFLINNQSLETIKFKLIYGFLLYSEKIRFNIIIKLLQNNRIKNLSIKKSKNTNKFYGNNINDVNNFLNYWQTNNTLNKLKIYFNNLNPDLLGLIINNNKTLEYIDLLNCKINNINLMLE